MPICKRCGEKIEFKPHPISGKLSPFSLNGDIHFAKCKETPLESKFSVRNSIEQMRCPHESCRAKPKWIYWSLISSGVRIRITFDCHHMGYWLAEVEKNVRAINITEEEYLDYQIKNNKDPWGAYLMRKNKTLPELKLKYKNELQNKIAFWENKTKTHGVIYENHQASQNNAYMSQLPLK